MAIKRLIVSCSLILVVSAAFFSGMSCSGEYGENAKWIVHPAEDTIANQWLVFRKTFYLDEIPSGEVLADVATDSKYWLFVNGEMVVFEGGLKRGPNPDDTYMDRVDIGPSLSQGENVIAVLVWFFGKDGFSHKNSGLPGLYLCACDSELPLLTDSTWKVITHPSFGETDEPYPNYRLPESNILYDARNEVGEWHTAGYDDTEWYHAVEKGVPPVAPWNKLVERPVPNWKDYGISRYDGAPRFPVTVANDTVIIVPLPYNAQVTPGFRIVAPEGKSIVISTDNYFGGSAYNVRTEYITREGEQDFETPGWMNGHYVHYEIPAGIEVHDLFFRETGYNTEFTGYFNSDDPFYDLLWKKSVRSLYINMRDTYMDCPDRERAQWWGDVTLQLEQSFYAFDRDSDHLARKGILELINWQRADSTIYSPVPSGNWENELPMQMLASTGYYGIWNYYYYSGDTATVKAVYPGVRRYLHVWERGEEGLVIERPGGWTWGDWGENRDMTLLFNLWYSLALKGFENMALLLGNDSDAQWAASTNKSLGESFSKALWTGTEYRSPGYSGQTDDRAHALAVLAGIAQEGDYKLIRDVLLREYHASPYMEKYVLESLIRMGFVDDALRRMKERFGPMVESELTTLWEGWGIGAAGFGGGTYNHGWSGGPLILLSRYIAGIAPAAPGFSEILFKPHPGHLQKAEANSVTSYGEISVRFSREGNNFVQEISSPEGRRLVVGVPELNRELTRVMHDNLVIWENGSGIDHPDVEFTGRDDDYLYFTLTSGNHIIRSY